MTKVIYVGDAKHTEDCCDKCNENVGKVNLTKVPFFYKDLNDVEHPDQGNGHRQYYVCQDCYMNC